MYDEKIVTTGISQGEAFIFVMKLVDGTYMINKSLSLGSKDSILIHSMEVFGDEIYLADSYNNKIYKYKIDKNELFETNVGRDPRHMSFDHGNIYVANFESDNISIIDLDTFTLSGSIPAGIKAHDVIYEEKNRSLYISCYEENKLVEYNLDSGKQRSFKTDGKPMHLFILQDTLIVMTYYANGDIHTKVNFIDLMNGSIEDVIFVDGLISDFILDYERDILYLLNIVDKKVYIADANLRKLIKSIYLGGYPESLSIGRDNIYITNSKKKQIALIEKKEYKLSSIEVQFIPDLIKVIH